MPGCREEATLAGRRLDDRKRPEDPDLPVIRSILEGDPEAYSVLIDRHDARLRRLVLGIVGDLHLVEDVLQEVYLVAYSNLSRFRGESLFLTWLTRIAVRQAISTSSRWRRVWRTQSSLTPLDESHPDSPADTAKSHDHRLADRDEALHLLARLPRRERAALVLAVEGWSYEEISELMKHPMGTVATWIHRARHRLKDLAPGARPAGDESVTPNRAAPSGREETA